MRKFWHNNTTIQEDNGELENEPTKFNKIWFDLTCTNDLKSLNNASK